MADDNDWEDDDSNQEQGQGRGGRKGNRGKQKSEPDVREDDAFGKDFITQAIQEVSNDIGIALGETTWGDKLLGALRRVDGGTGLAAYAVFPSLAALLNDPIKLRNAMRSVGMPEFFARSADGAVGDIIEGLRFVFRQKGKITKSDALKVKSDALKKLGETLKDKVSFEVALQSLTVEETKQFEARVAGLGKDRKAAFEKLSSKISSPKEPRVLLSLPDDQWITHLERIYGKADAKSGIESLAAKLENFLSTSIDKLTSPMSKEERDKLDAHHKEIEDKIDAKKAEIERLRKKRGW